MLSIAITAKAGTVTAGQTESTTLLSEALTPSQNTRYGLSNLLDHRSAYGTGVFPEPFLVDDSDLEEAEFRLDWLHTEGFHQRSDGVTAEIEKGFGLLTLEAEIAYERDSSDGELAEGIGNIDLGARYPLVQFVSESGFVDDTFGVALEVGIPANSSVSKNGEFVPKIFNDLRVGDHFTLQSVLGYSRLFGGGPDRGVEMFEYGFVFGWSIQHQELPLPEVQQLIPMFELSGETGLNKDNHGQSSILGDVGFRANFKAIGPIQPRLGLAFVFPLDRDARRDTHWGIATSLVFEY